MWGGPRMQECLAVEQACCLLGQFTCAGSAERRSQSSQHGCSTELASRRQASDNAPAPCGDQAQEQRTMPELPEVETVARSLAPHVTGGVIVAVRLQRADIVRPAGV